MSLHKNLLLLVIIPIFAGLPIQAGELNLDHVLNVESLKPEGIYYEATVPDTLGFDSVVQVRGVYDGAHFLHRQAYRTAARHECLLGVMVPPVVLPVTGAVFVTWLDVRRQDAAVEDIHCDDAPHESAGHSYPTVRPR